MKLKKCKLNWKSVFHVSHMLVTLLIIVLGIVGFIELKALTQENNTSYVISIYKENCLLDYYASKQKLVREVDKYIKSVAPKSCVNGLAIVDACIEYNIDIKFVLAQGKIESHFGTAGLASKTHSIFNVLAYDGRSASDMKKNGHAYSHPDLSIRPFLKLLTEKYLVNGKTEKNLMKSYVSSSGHRYASNRSYESELTNTYLEIERTTQISEYYKEFISYKIIAEQ